MRLFIALEIPQDLQDDVAALARQLKASVQGRFLPPPTYHLTLAFLGDMPEAVIPSIESVLEQTASSCEAITLQPDGLGKFGRGEDGTLWLGFAPTPELMRLAEELRSCLEDRGIPFDDKPFKPHLTLARRARIPKGELPALSFPYPATADVVTLFKSTLSKEGATYDPLYQASLEHLPR